MTTAPFRKDLCTTMDVSPDEFGQIERLVTMDTSDPSWERQRDEVDLITANAISCEAHVDVIEYERCDDGTFCAEIYGLPPRSNLASHWRVTFREKS